MARSASEQPTLHIAWFLLHAIAAHALDFALRILHPCTSCVFAEALKDKLEAAIKRMLHLDAIRDYTARVLFLPAVDGGCDFLDCSMAAPLAFVAAKLQVWPHVIATLAGAKISPTSVARILPLSDLNSAEQMVQQRGVYIDANGSISSVPPKSTLSWDRLPAASNGLYGQMLRMVHSTILDGCLSIGSEYQKPRLKSCGGIGSSFWSSIPDSATALTNSEFTRAVKYRLGLVQCPRDAVCHLHFLKDGSRCDKAIDLNCSHVVSCRARQGILRLHSGVQEIMLGALRSAGFFARKEVVVPAWSYVSAPSSRSRRQQRNSAPQVVEAWLDVVAHDGIGDSYYVDVTVRNPLARRYRVEGQSCSKTGFACEAISSKRRPASH